MGYSKEIYRLAQQELDRRRNTARDTAEKHQAEIYSAIPRIREIQKELADSGLRAVQAAIYGGPNSPQALSSLRIKNQALQMERVKLLESARLPADFLEVHYTCPKCQDTGYIINRRCECLEKLLRRFAYRQVSESGGLGECRFENFLLSYYPDIPNQDGKIPRKIMAGILNSCQEYARNFLPNGESLLFRGHTGLGKTHLSLAIAYEAIEKGYGVYYASSQRLLDKLQAKQFQRQTKEDTDYQEMAENCDLLILDDLGAEYSTNFTVAALQNLINVRLTESRPTIVSTNLNTSMLTERYGERSVSRLLCSYRAFTFCGDDIRMIKRMEH